MGNKLSSLSNNGTSNSTSDSHHNNILTNQLTNNVSQTQITLYFPIDEHVQCGKIGRITIDRNDPTLVILPIAPEINKSSVFRLISTPTSVPKMLNYYCAKCNDRFCKIVPSNYYSTPQYFCYLFPIKNTVRIGSWHTYYEIGKFKIRDFFIPDNKSDKYWEYDQQSNYNGFVSMLCETLIMRNNSKLTYTLTSNTRLYTYNVEFVNALIKINVSVDQTLGAEALLASNSIKYKYSIIARGHASVDLSTFADATNAIKIMTECLDEMNQLIMKYGDTKIAIAPKLSLLSEFRSEYPNDELINIHVLNARFVRMVEVCLHGIQKIPTLRQTTLFQTTRFLTERQLKKSNIPSHIYADIENYAI